MNIKKTDEQIIDEKEIALARRVSEYIGKKVSGPAYEDFGLKDINDFIESHPSYCALMQGKQRRYKDPKKTADYYHVDILYTIGYSHFAGGGCGCCGQDIDEGEEIFFLKLVDLDED